MLFDLSLTRDGRIDGLITGLLFRMQMDGQTRRCQPNPGKTTNG